MGIESGVKEVGYTPPMPEDTKMLARKFVERRVQDETERAEIIAMLGVGEGDE